MATVQLVSSSLSPSTKTVPCSRVVLMFKRDTIAEPYANPGTLAEVQTQSQENPSISLTGVQFLSGSSDITLADLFTLGKINYDGTNAPILRVIYGRDSDGDGRPDTTTALAAYAGSSNISVIVKDFNVSIDASDSKDGYRPVATVNLVETS